MNIIVFALIVVAAALVVAWNFHPGLRAKLRGWSTIAEGVIGTVLAYFGMFTDALKEAQAMGYLPENLQTYLPTIILVWIIVKRLQTKTPVGEK